MQDLVAKICEFGKRLKRLPYQSEDPTSCAPALQLRAFGDHGQKFAGEKAVTGLISNWQKIRVP